MAPLTKLDNFQITGLDVGSGIQKAGNNPANYLNFLKGFHKNGKSYRSELQAALLESDNARLRVQVHGLRGVAATLGAVKLDKACAILLQQLEDHAVAPDLMLVSDVLHTLDKLLNSIEHSAILEQDWGALAENPVHGLLQELRLVFIEDESLLREVFINELKKHFGETVWFALMYDALSYLKTRASLDKIIIITDAKLPDGSGIELAKAMAEEYSSVHILLMSGEEIPSEDLTGLENCISILKPIEVGELLNLCKGIAVNIYSQEDTSP